MSAKSVATDVCNSLYRWIKFDRMQCYSMTKNDLLGWHTDDWEPAPGHLHNLMIWAYRGSHIARFYLGLRKVEFILSLDYPRAVISRLNGIWQQMSDRGMTMEYIPITYEVVDDKIKFSYIGDGKHLITTPPLTGIDTPSFFLPLFITNIKQPTVTIPVCDDTRGLL